MSRTLRTNTYNNSYSKTEYRQTSVRETKHGASRKMTPYQHEDRWEMKFACDGSERLGTSRTAKLIRDNANRSLKKSMRQKLKRENRELLNED